MPGDQQKGRPVTTGDDSPRPAAEGSDVDSVHLESGKRGMEMDEDRERAAVNGGACDRENPELGWNNPLDFDTLDEFIANDVESVHFEALDHCRWYANVKLADGQLWTLNFGSVTGRAKGYANAEQVE